MENKLQQAAACMPLRLRSSLEQLDAEIQQQCEEIRMRVECPLTVAVGRQEHCIPNTRVTTADVQETVDRAAEYSFHAVSDSMRQGYITASGGHRIGICGQTAVHQGEVLSFRSISSLNIRIAREIHGAAKPDLLHALQKNGCLQSALFLAPPGIGKTTLLRDLARQLSDTGIRTAIADERSELAAMVRGVPQFDIGQHTDVLDGCPKAEAAMMLVKTMSPMLLVMDELTAEQDVRAAVYASHCGAAVIASAHAWDIDDFKLRPLYKELMQAAVFSQYYQISSDRTVHQINWEA